MFSRELPKNRETKEDAKYLNTRLSIDWNLIEVLLRHLQDFNVSFVFAPSSSSSIRLHKVYGFTCEMQKTSSTETNTIENWRMRILFNFFLMAKTSVEKFIEKRDDKGDGKEDDDDDEKEEVDVENKILVKWNNSEFHQPAAMTSEWVGAAAPLNSLDWFYRASCMLCCCLHACSTNKLTARGIFKFFLPHFVWMCSKRARIRTRNESSFNFAI